MGHSRLNEGMSMSSELNEGKDMSSDVNRRAEAGTSFGNAAGRLCMAEGCVGIAGNTLGGGRCCSGVTHGGVKHFPGITFGEAINFPGFTFGGCTWGILNWGSGDIFLRRSNSISCANLNLPREGVRKICLEVNKTNRG